MNLFNHLENLTLNKIEFDPKDDEQNKTYAPYIINRFISMCQMYIPLVNEINKYNVPKDVHYTYFFSTLPKRKQYFNYIKKKKDVDEENIKYIMEYFECGDRQAKIIINTLKENQIAEIVAKYNHGKK